MSWFAFLSTKLALNDNERRCVYKVLHLASHNRPCLQSQASSNHDLPIADGGTEAGSEPQQLSPGKSAQGLDKLKTAMCPLHCPLGGRPDRAHCRCYFACLRKVLNAYGTELQKVQVV